MTEYTLDTGQQDTIEVKPGELIKINNLLRFQIRGDNLLVWYQDPETETNAKGFKYPKDTIIQEDMGKTIYFKNEKDGFRTAEIECLGG